MTVAASQPPHLLNLAELSDEHWHGLLASAEVLAGESGRRPWLPGLRAAMLFFNPSLRTRTSFEVACHDLGAHAVSLVVGGNTWGFEHRTGVVMDGAEAEHVREAVGSLCGMIDVLGVRAFAGLDDAEEDASDPLLHAIAEASQVPVLNLESAMDHPHQGLADALTLRRALAAREAGRDDGPRPKVVLSWAPHVKPLPLAVPHAALTAFAREGHDVVLAHPRGFELDAGVLSRAQVFAAAAGGTLSVTDDREGALAGADAVYLKAWGSREHYGDPAAGAAACAERRDWMLTAADLGSAFFMHCLPVRRGVVVADEVLDGPRSLVLQQAAARLHVQKATLCHVLGRGPGLGSEHSSGGSSDRTSERTLDSTSHDGELP